MLRPSEKPRRTPRLRRAYVATWVAREGGFLTAIISLCQPLSQRDGPGSPTSLRGLRPFSLPPRVSGPGYPYPRSPGPFLCSRPRKPQEASNLRLSVLLVVEQFGSVPSKTSYLLSNLACLPKFLFALGNPLQLLG